MASHKLQAEVDLLRLQADPRLYERCMDSERKLTEALGDAHRQKARAERAEARIGVLETGLASTRGELLEVAFYYKRCNDDHVGLRTLAAAQRLASQACLDAAAVDLEVEQQRAAALAEMVEVTRLFQQLQRFSATLAASEERAARAAAERRHEQELLQVRSNAQADKEGALAAMAVELSAKHAADKAKVLAERDASHAADVAVLKQQLSAAAAEAASTGAESAALRSKLQATEVDLARATAEVDKANKKATASAMEAAAAKLALREKEKDLADAEAARQTASSSVGAAVPVAAKAATKPRKTRRPKAAASSSAAPAETEEAPTTKMGSPSLPPSSSSSSSSADAAAAAASLMSPAVSLASPSAAAILMGLDVARVAPGSASNTSASATTGSAAGAPAPLPMQELNGAAPAAAEGKKATKLRKSVSSKPAAKGLKHPAAASAVPSFSESIVLVRPDNDAAMADDASGGDGGAPAGNNPKSKAAKPRKPRVKAASVGESADVGAAPVKSKAKKRKSTSGDVSAVDTNGGFALAAASFPAVEGASDAAPAEVPRPKKRLRKAGGATLSAMLNVSTGSALNASPSADAAPTASFSSTSSAGVGLLDMSLVAELPVDPKPAVKLAAKAKVKPVKQAAAAASSAAAAAAAEDESAPPQAPAAPPAFSLPFKVLAMPAPPSSAPWPEAEPISSSSSSSVPAMPAPKPPAVAATFPSGPATLAAKGFRIPKLKTM